MSYIAGELGVSKTTVSFVLNGKGDAHNISKETQEKIMKLVEELHYIPNQAARSLKSGITRTIAYIVPNVANPFFAKIGRLIEGLMATRGYHVIFSSTDEDPSKESRLIHGFLARQVDGLIIASCDLTSDANKLIKQQEVPVIYFDREEKRMNESFILVENKLSMQKAVGRLLATGVKKPGLLSITPGISPLEERIKGYKSAMKKAGKRVNPDMIRTVDQQNTRQSTMEEMKHLIYKGADALVFTNNLLAAEALWIINRHYPELKGRLRLLSFDNIDIFDYAIPRVTSIAQPVDKISKHIVDILMQNIKHKGMKKKRVVLEPDIINRN